MKKVRLAKVEIDWDVKPFSVRVEATTKPGPGGQALRPELVSGTPENKQLLGRLLAEWARQIKDKEKFITADISDDGTEFL